MQTTIMPVLDGNLPATQSRSMLDVEQSKAVQAVQAALVIAKRFPRDMTASYTRIMKEFERPSLAESAIYSYPRGGQTVTGPSIRLAEVMARNFGNFEAGIIEVERRDGVSICEAFAWDLETNVRERRTFEVAHVRDTKGGRKPLTDERDIRELIANVGARLKRSCTLAIIPSDFTEDAVNRAKKVAALGDGRETIEARIRRVVLAFKDQGVTQDMLEARLGHPMDITVADEIVELQGIFNSLKDKTAKREDYFEIRKNLDDLVAEVDK